MPDGLTVNDVLKLTDPDGFGGSEVSENELRYIAQGEGTVPFGQIERTIESNIGKDVSPSDIQASAQALLDLSEGSFGGDLDATVQFLRETVAESPEAGNVDFADAVNSGRAAEFVDQTRYGASTTPSPDFSDDEVARMKAEIEAAEAQIEEAQTDSDSTTPANISTLDDLSEYFRANEHVNESGFAEGIVVREEQNMPNLDGDFGRSAPPVTMESQMNDIRHAQTSKVLESVGMDSQAVLEDGKVEDYEFAQTVSKAGYKAMENEAESAMKDGAVPWLTPENMTEEHHPEAHAKAMEFGEAMNLDLNGHPEIVVGLMAVELGGNDEIMNAIMEAQRTALDTGPTTTAQQPDVGTTPAMVDPAVTEGVAGGMKLQ